MYKQRRLRSSAIVITLALVMVMTLVSVSPGFAQAKGKGKLKDIEKFVKKAQKNLEKQDTLSFRDLQEALWAIASIAKMKGFGIINGYEGNVFKPNSAVTQAEALAMIVRALDMEEEAQEIARRFGGTYEAFGFEADDSRYRLDWDDFDDEDDLEDYLEDLARYLQSRSKKVNNNYLPFVPSNTRWALGYILLAVEEGWVKISEVNPNASASRAWVSMVMVRALGEDAAAQQMMNTKLPYKDANAIPKGMVGYVAVAVELGLFQGYPGGEFKPNRAVTRAEMATIIDRFLTEELPEETDFNVSGTVTAIKRNSITVKAESGRSSTFTISPDALILVNNLPAEWDDLSVGDTVEVLTNGQGVALYIKLLDGATGPKTETVTGQIVLIASDRRLFIEEADDDVRLIKLASNCKITYGSTTLSFGDLRVGDMVQATVDANNVATALKVTQRAHTTVAGQIVSIPGSRRLNVKDASGTIQLIRLATNCQITYGSTTMQYSDLRVGDKVEATIGPDNLVTALKVTALTERPETVAGVIYKITTTTSGTSVVVVRPNQPNVTLAVADDVSITYGNSTLDLDDLRTGDRIRATVLGGLTIDIVIEARNQSTEFGDVGGDIISISQSGSDFIVTVDDEGVITSFDVPTTCVITYGNTSLSRHELRLGDEIRAELNSANDAVEIWVLVRGS